MQITDYPVFLNIEAGMSLTAIVSVIFNALLLAGGIAGLVVMVFGGIKYLTSAGDPSKTKDAKKRIFAAILGLIILFSSWVILNSINPDLVNIKNPGDLPLPIVVTPVTPPITPPVAHADFYYIPLGKVIDDVVAQEKATLPKMQDFASSAGQCDKSLCEGGTCEYEEEVCNPICSTTCDEAGECTETCEIVCTIETRICSAPCNNGDPCPASKAAAIDRVLKAASKMGEEITKLQQAKEKIKKCVFQKDTMFLSCQETFDMFDPESKGQTIDQWGDVKDCRQGYDFYCAYGADKDVYLERIILPFEAIKESIASVRELASIISSCSCSSCSFACGKCSRPCSGIPCPGQTYSDLASAVGAVDELETRLKKLEETISEISFLSITDEVVTLTCPGAYSWLISIKESGCPKIATFPCCPVDKETEKIIRNCQGTDFFFCSAP